jgi:serine/threonine protein kinase
MNPTEKVCSELVRSDPIDGVASGGRPDESGHCQRPSKPAPPLEDPRVILAVEEYLAALEAGHRPKRQEFLARSPEIAAALGPCLDILEFVQTATPRFHSPEGDPTEVSSTFGSEARPVTPLGDYRILREVGRGGMGIVYEAEQLSLGRRVALKVLPFAAGLDGKQLQRFKNEAQAAAGLHHAHIVPVYAVGCERGVHFYAMQLIDGQSLAALIRELRQLAGHENADEVTASRPVSTVAQELASRGGAPVQPGPAVPQPTGLSTQPPRTPPAPGSDLARQPAAARSNQHSLTSPAFFRTAASLGVQAARALEHAHQLGIVHRDVKPGNLLVDGCGQLWVADFGLAHCQGGGGLTLTGDLVGTLRYMSPEQALAKPGLLDHRTDVYGLGATLYELLTLEPAFPGQDREELLRQIAFEEPKPPRRLNPAVPAELETIVLKALAKAPEERYATAQELADDLGRFLKDEPIRARRPTLGQRLRKWARRHRPMVWALGVALVVALLNSAAVLWREKQWAEEALRLARQAQQAEQRARQKVERSLYFQGIPRAGATASRSSGTRPLPPTRKPSNSSHATPSRGGPGAGSLPSCTEATRPAGTNATGR